MAEKFVLDYLPLALTNEMQLKAMRNDKGQKHLIS